MSFKGLKVLWIMKTGDMKNWLYDSTRKPELQSLQNAELGLTALGVWITVIYNINASLGLTGLIFT